MVFLCLCCEQCVFNSGTKVSATERWKLRQLMKMVQSSDARLCGPSNWGDCLILLLLCFSLWRPVKLALSETHTHKHTHAHAHTQNAHWRTGGAGGKESGDGKTAFRKKKERSLRPPPEEMRRQAERGGGGWRKLCACVNAHMCLCVSECQSSSGCQTSVIDHKPTQPSCCWGLSLNRCTSFTLTDLLLMIQYIRARSLARARARGHVSASLSLVHRAQRVLDDFHVSVRWSTVSHSHWSGKKKKKRPSRVDSSRSLLSSAPNSFSTIWVRTLCPTHVWTLIVPHCAHSFIILTADALHLNSSPTYPKVLQHCFAHFCVCVLLGFFYFYFIFYLKYPQKQVQFRPEDIT